MTNAYWVDDKSGGKEFGELPTTGRTLDATFQVFEWLGLIFKGNVTHFANVPTNGKTNAGNSKTFISSDLLFETMKHRRDVLLNGVF